jgi:hypothetical protein
MYVLPLQMHHRHKVHSMLDRLACNCRRNEKGQEVSHQLQQMASVYELCSQKLSLTSHAASAVQVIAMQQSAQLLTSNASVCPSTPPTSVPRAVEDNSAPQDTSHTVHCTNFQCNGTRRLAQLPCCAVHPTASNACKDGAAQAASAASSGAFLPISLTTSSITSISPLVPTTVGT